MDNIARLSPEERSQVFFQNTRTNGSYSCHNRKGFLGLLGIGKIFMSENLRSKLLFKGGTSLSKVYNDFERFSEDIDLVLNWNLVSCENPNLGRSKNKQNKFNKQINELAQEYIVSQLLPELEVLYAPLFQVDIDQKDPLSVNIIYPKAFVDTYIRPVVRLEIDPLAFWQPSREFTITSYAAQYFPGLFNNVEISVRAIEGKRTFWEKVTILHQRLEIRHYPILICFVMQQRFKKKFYSVGWAHYETSVPGSLKLIPSETYKNSVIKDYQAMQDMIIGNKPSIPEILADLEEHINSLQHFGMGRSSDRPQ